MEYKNYEYGTETENGKECTYGLVVESCSRCLFEALCRLEQSKEKQNKNSV